MKKRFYLAGVLLVVLYGDALAAALDPVVVDPAAQDRDRERQQQRRDSLEQLEALPSAPQAADGNQASAEGPAFELRSVRFSRSDYLGDAQLRGVVQPYLGRKIRFADLQQLVADVNALYRREGVFTALAVLPKQRIENGEVLVRLIEGKLGKLVVEGSSYTDPAYVRGWIRQRDDVKTIDSRGLENDIQAHNRVNDQRLLAELRAGEAFGLTDIVLKVQDPARNSLQLFVDNYSYESSGRDELGVVYRRQQLWQPGDRFTAYGVVSEGMRAMSTSYNLPLGHSRWRVGPSVSLTSTKVVEGDFAVLDVVGDSLRVNLDASRLLFSQQRYWGTLLLSAGYTDSQTEVAGVGLSEYRNSNADAGLQFNYLGTQWQLTAKQMASQVQARDQVLDQRNDVLLWRGNLSSIYRFGDSSVSALLQGDWQYTRDRELGGSLGYTVGGASSVRGYLPGAVSGDVGFSSSLEGHYAFAGAGMGLDTFLFVDHGYVRSRNPEQRLTAAGLGLRSSLPHGLSLDLTAGNALEDVVPNQDDWVYYARLAWQCL